MVRQIGKSYNLIMPVESDFNTDTANKEKKTKLKFENKKKKNETNNQNNQFKEKDVKHEKSHLNKDKIKKITNPKV